MPGPAPKRSEERRRRNSPPATPVEVPSLPLEAPELPAGVHPLARDWFDSLKRSGQAVFYEPSDWMGAVFVAMAMTRFLEAEVPSGALMKVIVGAQNDLLSTESARRRAHVEVHRPQLPGAPAALFDYRTMKRGGRRIKAPDSA
jgi:hypothetical protein